ncbi:MAG: RNA polymerase sigma factor RpoD/SigA, partial [Myxococcota bacterium]|nr:RNA polymerase sigma factor RpoD/SigA [Myxococcota bacterium]
MKDPLSTPYTIGVTGDGLHRYLRSRGSASNLSREQEETLTSALARAQQTVVQQLWKLPWHEHREECDVPRTVGARYAASETEASRNHLRRVMGQMTKAVAPATRAWQALGKTEAFDELLVEPTCARPTAAESKLLSGLSKASKRTLRRSIETSRERIASLEARYGITRVALLAIHEDVTEAEAEIERCTELLVNGHIPQVIRIARSYTQRGLQLTDVIQEGVVGLLRAITLFDPTRGFRLSTYAAWWIKQSIHRAIADQSRSIRIPIHTLEWLTKVRQTESYLATRDGSKPTAEEIAELTGSPPKQVEQALNTVRQPLSLDRPVTGDEGGTLLDLLTHPQTPSGEDVVMAFDLRTKLGVALQALSPREEAILRMRFGFGMAKSHTLEEIGQKFQISRERIRQLEVRALNKLRTHLGEDTW